LTQVPAPNSASKKSVRSATALGRTTQKKEGPVGSFKKGAINPKGNGMKILRTADDRVQNKRGEFRIIREIVKPYDIVNGDLGGKKGKLRLGIEFKGGEARKHQITGSC